MMLESNICNISLQILSRSKMQEKQACKYKHIKTDAINEI